MKYESRLLKVSKPSGERIRLFTLRNGSKTVLLTVKHLDLVEKDNPPFAKDGVIKFTCERKNYQQSVVKVTKYLEDLFLKGLSDENMDSSPRAINDTGRNKEKYPKGYIGVDRGKGRDTSVHSGPRREKSTESSGRGKSDSKLDKSSDKKTVPEDKSRD